MSKVYLLRHDAVGVLDVLFTGPPTEDEVKALAEGLAQLHGRGHRKFNDPSHPQFVGEAHPEHGRQWVLHVEEREVHSGYAEMLKLLAEARVAKSKVAVKKNTGPTGEGASPLPINVHDARGVVTNPSPES